MIRIKKLLKELNMTQEELGFIVGLDQAEISKIANGKRPDLTLRTAAKIARALGESVEYVFPDYFTR
jgi:transcriptional regulator with XRE-family HTH domain